MSFALAVVEEGARYFGECASGARNQSRRHPPQQDSHKSSHDKRDGYSSKDLSAVMKLFRLASNEFDLFDHLDYGRLIALLSETSQLGGTKLMHPIHECGQGARADRLEQMRFEPRIEARSCKLDRRQQLVQPLGLIN